MTNDDGVVRSISWRDLCPWLILFRLYRLSISIQLLALAFLGVGATVGGWHAASAVCLSNVTRQRQDVERFMASVSSWPEVAGWQPMVSSIKRSVRDIVADESVPPGVPPVDVAAASPRAEEDVRREIVSGPLGRFWHGWLGKTPMYAIMEPVRRWFDPTIDWNLFAFYLFGGLWSLLVWSFIGGAITRTAVVRLGCDQRVGLRESLEFSSRKLLSTLGAPLLPLVAIFSLGVPLFFLGLMMRLDLGVAFGSLLWLPVGLIGFSMAMFAVGVMFGWPLMWSAISTEGSDTFDAISRSYAYTYQRPLQYLAYSIVAMALGLLGWIIVGLFCQSVVQLSLLAVGTGIGDARLATLQAALAGRANDESTLLWFGAKMIGLSNRCFLGIQVAFAYSFMWCAAAGIYLLLRQDADQTEIDDIYLEEDASVSYGLPALVLDEEGVSGVDDAETPSDESSAKDAGSS